MPIETLSYQEAVAYGCIQGLTEFLPVSSSGHLALVHHFGLGRIDDALMRPFSVLLHVATLIAVLIAFRTEIIRALCQLNRVAWRNALLSVVPAVVVGLCGSSFIHHVEGNIILLGFSFMATALLLLVTDRVLYKRKIAAVIETQSTDSAAVPVQAELSQQSDLTALSLRQALLVGLGQAMALLPGVSRSGSSLCAAVLSGVERKRAFAYSFLVGIPLIGGAAAHEYLLTDDFAPMIEAIGWGPLVCSMLCALLSGLIAISLLRFVIAKRCLSVFGLYCALLAGMCLVFAIIE